MDLSETIESLSRGFEAFKASHIAELKLEREEREELERKVNKLRLGGAPTSLPEGYSAEEHKMLDAAIRAALSGNQTAANKYLRDATAEFKATAMQTGVDPEGGYITSYQFSRDLTRVMLETAPLLDHVRIIPNLTGDSFEEIEDLNEAGASWVGETQARDGTTSPDVGKLTIQLREIYAMPQATQKLIDTAAFDVVSWLSEKVGEKFGNSVADGIINGNGITQPRGLLTYPTAATADASRPWGTIEHVASGAAGAFKAAGSDPADCLIDLVSRLKSQFRAGAAWYMNRGTEGAVRKLKDSQGRFLLVDSLIAGQPKTLLGYPVVETEQMPDIAANSYSIAFGNLKKAYTVVQGVGPRLLVDPYTNKPYVRLYTYQRVGGQMTNSQAIKLLKFAAS